MHPIIEQTSSDQLLAALTSNMVAFWSPYGRGKGCTLHATPHLVWFYTGIPATIFNGVLFAQLEKPGAVRATVDRLQAEIDRHGAAALWWLGPQSRPEGLGSLLERHGLQPGGEVPGMAVDLDRLDDAPQRVPGLAVEQATGREMQALWAQTVALGTGFPGHVADALARVEAGLADPQYRAQRRYIGYLDGTPVATSALVLESGVAGIYAVATLPQARRKGIGTLVTLLPLLEARAMGYRVGVLQASPMGYPVYGKMGFTDVCAYRHYVQQP